MAVLKFSLLRNPRAVYFTHWILAFSDSLDALRNSMLQIGQDIRKAALQHPGNLHYWLEAAVSRPVVPPAEMLLAAPS